MSHSRAIAGVKHVLAVLDNDSDVRDSLKFWLGIEGFEVRTYASPAELFNDDKVPDFECLIVDYHLPRTNGLDVIAKLRERRSSVPAILMTVHCDGDLRQRASTAGAILVEKPFEGTVLIEWIRTLLEAVSQ